MKTKIKILLPVLFLILAVVLSFYLLQGEDVALAGSGHNLSGFAWSDNIGWISFNCTNREADTGKTCFDANNPAFNPAINLVDYGINVTGGLMSGYAWSDNVGWIDFNPTSGYPEAPLNGGRLDVATGQITGWAKAVAGGSPEAGGWDGWIKLGNDSNGDGVYDNGLDTTIINDYGIMAGPIVGTTCDWSGYAWGGDGDDNGFIDLNGDGIDDLEGDEVIGWIKFFNDADSDGVVNNDPDSLTDYGVKGTDDACATVVSSDPDLVINPINNISNITQGNSAIFAGEVKEKNNVNVTDMFEVRFCVDSANEAGCFNDTSGFIINEQNIASLSAGATLPIVSNSWDSSSYSLGAHKLFICADVEDSVSEPPGKNGASDNCRKKNFNITSVAPVCGNEIIEAGEDCDGGNLGSKTCVDFGFTGGNLNCNASCQFDTSSCTSSSPPSRPWWQWRWQEK